MYIYVCRLIGNAKSIGELCTEVIDRGLAAAAAAAVFERPLFTDFQNMAT